MVPMSEQKAQLENKKKFLKQFCVWPQGGANSWAEF